RERLCSENDEKSEKEKSPNKTPTKGSPKQTEEEVDPKIKSNKAEKSLIALGHLKNMNDSIISSPEIFIGREEEIDRSVRVLRRKQKRNLMIIGESGTGKTSL